MADFEVLNKKIEGKLRFLEFTTEETEKIISSKDSKAVARHHKTIETLIDKIHELKIEAQEILVEKGDELDEIRAWTTNIENQIAKFEDIFKEVKSVGDGINLEEQLELEKAKLEVQAKAAEKLKPLQPQVGTEGTRGAKLPKLVITKFQGTHLDWVRFWGQFETEIDRANLSQVAKFSYLKELLLPKVRASVDGLPFTTEGYERAKSILSSKYGKPSEVANAHMQCIISLPTINGANPVKIHDFYNKLASNIQTLETMGKIKEIKGFVRTTLEKLPGIRADLVRMDDNWQEWGFPELIESLKKWCDRNPLLSDERKTDHSGSRPPRKDQAYQAKAEGVRPQRVCVYCEAEDHKLTACDRVTDGSQRKKILSEKKLCFNCAGSRHRASECRSKYMCQHCGGKHHTSICDKSSRRSNLMLATGEGTVIYPVVVVEIDGIRCRALLDTGSGSSYASATLIESLKKSPARVEPRLIEMMMCSTTQMVKSYQVRLTSIDKKFEMSTTVNKVDKGVLLTIPNPRYTELTSKYRHLEGVRIDDNDKKSELPIHLILGASEYSRIKTETKPRIGEPHEPIAELTKLGWTLMSPGKETATHSYHTRTSAADYAELCSLDVLGLGDRSEDDQGIVFDEFVEQLQRTKEGWYQTGLLWKQGHGPLPTNEQASKKRLEYLLRKLDRQPGMLDKYDEIIQSQLTEGIVEEAEDKPSEKTFYIPHKPVIKETAETTKLRIVYDASAKTNEAVMSLNDCLETGPPLQNLLWDVLVRNRMKPIALAGDMKQAFLQIRIRPEDRDVLRFHWVQNKNPSSIVALRFTRALFGLVQSPFLLAGTVTVHLNKLKEKYPSEVEEIQKSLYVDDIITGGETEEEVADLKKTTIAIFEEAAFKLHKWNSNKPALEGEVEQRDGEQSYAKQKLCVNPGETKLLGLLWDKKRDEIAVTFPRSPSDVTKREMLRFLASVYDPLGLASPTMLIGKLMFREACDRHLPWDEKLTDRLAVQWHKFVESLPSKIEVPRSLSRFEETVDSVTLHAFGDASGAGIAAAVYAVVEQASGVSQGLMVAKSRLAKKNLSIPRLELVSAHMAANLVHNVKSTLVGYPVNSVIGWLDSTVALHWIQGGGSYKQFVANRVRKIKEKDFIEWRYVNTDRNPADIGSRGCKADQLSGEWIQGPEWLTRPELWPTPVETKPSNETEAEARMIKDVLTVALESEDPLNQILQKHQYWRAIRVVSWIARFIHNCKSNKVNRISGPLSTVETNSQVRAWILRTQQNHVNTDQFQEDQIRLNLQKNEDGLYECRGRIQGCYPIYLPPDSLFTEKLVQDIHLLSLHGGVGLTMSLVRKDYWVPRLRQLVKKTIRLCYGCKRFHTTAFHKPPPGNLPVDRTEGSSPFQVLGVDYAGPISYKVSKKKEGKAYILLFACSLTRAIHLEVVTNLTTDGLIMCLKRLIARRGRPVKIYSDNGKSFVAAAKWLRKIMNEEKVQDYLAHQCIKWQFNLSRAPWWGGQFERLVGVVKQAFYKAIGRACLTLNELEEVLLDVEIAVNNRPLTYVEDDIQLPLLTPNVMLHGQSNLLPEVDVEGIEDLPLRKRAKYLRRCKNVLWSRWTGEYVRSLRERHNLKHKSKQLTLKVGDVVLIQSEDRNRGKWNLGVVVKLIIGRDGVVRAVKLRAGKSYLERAVQQLCPMELSCDRGDEQLRQPLQLNPRARAFNPRRAAVAAAERIKAIAEEEQY